MIDFQLVNQSYYHVSFNQKGRQWLRVNEDVDKVEPSCIAEGNVQRYSHFGKKFGSSSKLNTVSQQFCSLYLLKTNESICPHENLYMNDHSSVSQKLDNSYVPQLMNK